ncbi:hypothetical protein [Nocardia terpenica]|uniref:Uncharacterized protein n=1 Tax=Nocardia terpenica TaxID=455432 RepID=A0A6G9YZ02_9NOCA|nr:hypothetical protein [Nocardia terpenica]QIS18545.1 hypothetical protein F6W96_09830 [Nocardia terpenica]
MSEFYVDEIFPVSFRPTPFLVGRAIGDFVIGQHVELRKRDGASYQGVLESVDFHKSPSGQYSFVFSEGVSLRAEPGDVIYSIPADNGVGK